MAYSTSNPPVKVAGAGPNGPQLWMYVSEDVHTDVDAANYFSNGKELGMRVNDTVIVTKSTATIGCTMHTVTEVSSDGATVAPAILA